MSDSPRIHPLTIRANAHHEDAIIEGDRSALTRLHAALGKLLAHNSSSFASDQAYAQRFFDSDGEEYDVLIRLNEDL